MIYDELNMRHCGACFKLKKRRYFFEGIFVDMILDTLDNIDFYFGLSRELDGALSVLKHYNLSLLEAGEYPDFPISGCNTTLKILEPEIITDENSIPWEYHENWIDVQCVLAGGSELIGYAPRNRLSGWVYHPEIDTAYTNTACSALPIRMEEYDFSIFFPQDAHRKIQSSGTPGYHKLVLKVPAHGTSSAKWK